MLSYLQPFRFLLKAKFWIALVLIVLVLWGGIKACSSNNTIGKKIYRIAKDDTWFPLNLMGKEKNMSAFCGDLVLEIARIENFFVEVTSVPTDNLLHGLEDGAFDGIITSVGPNPSHTDQYVLSDPFYLLGPVLVVPYSSRVHSLAEMEGLIIGISSGPSLAYNTKMQLSALFIPYNNINMALEDLEKNKLDGVIIDALPAYVYTKGLYKGKEKVVTSALNNAGLRLKILNKGAAASLVEKFNEGLTTLKKNGRYKELLDKWDLVDTSVKELQK